MAALYREAVDGWQNAGAMVMGGWKAQLERHLRAEYDFGVDDLPGWRWEEGVYETASVADWCQASLSDIDCLLARFLGNAKISSRTRKAYAADLESLAMFMGLPLRDAVTRWFMSTPDEARRTAAELRRSLEDTGRAAATVARRMSALKRLASRAYDAQLIPEDLSIEIPALEPRRVNARNTSPPVDVEPLLRRLLQSEQWQDWRLAAAVALVSEQGLSADELVRLETKNLRVADEAGSIRLPRLFSNISSGLAKRPLTELATQGSAKWYAIRGGRPGFVFSQPDEVHPVTLRTLQRGLTRALKELRMPPTTFQDMRMQKVAEVQESKGPAAAAWFARTRSYGTLYNLNVTSGVKEASSTEVATGVLGEFLRAYGLNTAAACCHDFQTAGRALKEMGLGHPTTPEDTAELLKATPEKLDVLYAHIETGSYGAGTKRRILANLNAYRGFLGSSNFVVKGPRIEPYQNARYAPTKTIERAMRCLEAQLDEPLAARAALAIVLVYREQVREADLLEMAIEDVDVENSRIRIRRFAYVRGPEEVERYWWTVESDVVKYLRIWIEHRGMSKGALITSLTESRQGRRLTRQGLWSSLKKYGITLQATRNRGLAELPEDVAIARSRLKHSTSARKLVTSANTRAGSETRR